MTREQKLEAALRQIAMKAFRQTDIGENHAAGLSGIRDRHTFLAIRDMANEALAIPTDADTRVVTVDQLKRWRVYSTDDDTHNEIRAIIGEVK